MTTTSIHTEATLKIRHQEALDIFHAWLDRHHITGGKEAQAVEIQMDEAWDWVERTAEDLHLYRQVTRHKTTPHGRSAPNTSGRLHAHRRH